MTELLCHDLSGDGMVTPNVSLIVGYSNALRAPMARGSVSFPVMTSAVSVIMPAVADLYDRITEKSWPVRRVMINFNDIKPKDDDRQLSIFDLADDEAASEGATDGQMRKERMADETAGLRGRMKRDEALQDTVNKIRDKYGKDAMFRGMDLEEAATTRERNHQVGGHRE